MTQQASGRVYLVGAGPGDPALLTLRGAECLRRADVVLYDALSHPALLDSCPQAEQRNVGTRSEERRVGKECRLTCRSRWSPYH